MDKIPDEIIQAVKELDAMDDVKLKQAVTVYLAFNAVMENKIEGYMPLRKRVAVVALEWMKELLVADIK